MISCKSDEGPAGTLVFDSDAIVGVVSVLRKDLIGDSPTEVMNRMRLCQSMVLTVGEINNRRYDINSR